VNCGGSAQRRRLGWHVGSADMLGRRSRQQPVDDAGAVEPGDDLGPARHGGGLEPAYLLHPSDVELDVWTLGSQRIETALGAPTQEHPQVRLGMGTRQALVAGEVPGHSPTKNIGPFDGDQQRQNFQSGSHALDCAPGGRRGSSRGAAGRVSGAPRWPTVPDWCGPVVAEPRQSGPVTT
jgi:hypothetical protein